MIASVLDERRLPSLRGNLAIAHCRYSTTGSTIWENAQPTFRLGPRRAVAVGHNGNLVNTRELLGQLHGGRARLPGVDRHRAADGAPRRRAERRHGRGPPARAAARPRRLQPGRPRRAPGDRRPRPVRLPPARPRPAARARSAAEGAAEPGLWGDDDAAAGWILSSETTGLDIVGAEYVRDVEPGEIVVLEAGAPAALGALRRGAQRAVRVRAHLLRPARFVHGGPQPVRGAPADGDAARRRASRRDRPRHAGPGHGRAGRGGLRRAIGDPVPRGARPQPLHGPDVHPAVPDAPPSRRDPQAQPAPRGRPRQAADRGRRLDRAGHHDEADRRPPPARRGEPRSTSGSAPRRSTTPASTGSTRRSRPS